MLDALGVGDGEPVERGLLGEDDPECVWLHFGDGGGVERPAEAVPQIPRRTEGFLQWDLLVQHKAHQEGQRVP